MLQGYQCSGLSVNPQSLRKAEDADAAVLVGQGVKVEAGGKREAEAVTLTGKGDRDIGPAGPPALFSRFSHGGSFRSCESILLSRSWFLTFLRRDC